MAKKKGGTGGMGAKNRAQKMAAEERRQEVCARYMRRIITGETISSIARDFGVSRRTIDKDIERSLRMLDETNKQAINEIVPQALETAKLIQAEAWKGWRRSCLEASSMTETQKSGGDGGPSTIISKTTARQAGDPRFLAEMRQAMSFLVDIEKRKKAAEENAPPKPPLLIGVVVDSAEQRDQVLSFAEFQERAKLPEG